MLRSRALRAVGELKRHDLLHHVRQHMADEDERCRFWAAWALTLYRDRTGLQSLARWLGKGDRFGRLAIQLSVRAMSLEDGRHWIRTMANDPGVRRCAVIGAGALGDPSSVPWLIGNMQSPELSRLAGEAFSMITGVDLEAEGLDQDDPASGEEADEPSSVDAPDLDEDRHLTWPKHALVEQWWRIHRGDFQEGMRYLAGQPLTTSAARHVLTVGNQRQRAAAAIELALREPSEILFEVRARGADQQRQLLAGDAGTVAPSH